MPSDTYTLTISDVGVSTPADGSVTTVKIADYNVAIAGTGVTTAKIVDGAITSAKIANGTIVEADIADSAITSIKIANGTVTGTDIATGTITSSNILDGTIAAGDIADGAITSAKILDGTIVEGDIANGAITSAKIADNTIVAGDIADATITSAKIAASTIAAGNIADATITSAKIAASTITGGNIALDTVSFGNIVEISDNVILGNKSGTTANVSSITCTDLGFSILETETALGVRTLLGLGTRATQPSSAVNITGGSITNVSISGISYNLSDATGVLSVSKGGTNLSSYISGDMLYASSPTSLSRLAKSSSSNYVLHGASISGSAPEWGLLNLETDVTGVLPFANGGTSSTNVDTLSFKTTGQTTDALATGELRWNGEDKTLDLKLAGDVTLQVGQETNIYVHNSELFTIPNGSVVYVYGADGDNPAVKLATNADLTASKTLGVATQSITSGQNGYITTQGLVRGLDTSAFSSGNSLWLGVGGALTATEPVFPATAVRVAIVVRDDVSLGSIFVQPQLFSDGRVSGSFRWAATGTGAGASSSGGHTIVGLTSTSSVIIQELGATPVGSMYSVVCSTDSFTVYARADSGNSTTGTLPLKETMFSYIAFI